MTVTQMTGGGANASAGKQPREPGDPAPWGNTSYETTLELGAESGLRMEAEVIALTVLR
jgi:hypothetical protein